MKMYCLISIFTLAVSAVGEATPAVSAYAKLSNV